jgi:Flp pilus assembly protein TadD
MPPCERFKQATDLDPALAEAFNNLGCRTPRWAATRKRASRSSVRLELDPAAAHVYNNLAISTIARAI